MDNGRCEHNERSCTERPFASLAEALQTLESSATSVDVKTFIIYLGIQELRNAFQNMQNRKVGMQRLPHYINLMNSCFLHMNFI